MDDLLKLVKQNLVLEHDEDDALLRSFLEAAISYAKAYQKKDSWDLASIPETTRQAIVLLASFFYESRDGATGGFFNNRSDAATQVFSTVNLLLRLDKDWRV